MRVRTKLVLTATALTFAIVLVLSIVFLSELLHQRVVQTSDSNQVLAQEVLLLTRQAFEDGLRANPPLASDPDPDAALRAAVIDALRSSEALSDLMNATVRYSPTVQDVSVSDAHDVIIVSTDPDAVNQRATFRTSFSRVRDGSLYYQLRQLFGRPRILDISAPLERNGMPFLTVHLGVRSTFLRNSYAPWLRTALGFALVATFASVFAAALLSTVALHPLQTVGEQLERLALERSDPLPGQPPLLLPASREADPVGRLNRTIDRLGRQMRSREEGYTALQENLDQMLDNLRDGVLLFTADLRAVMVSDSVANFLGRFSGRDGADGMTADSMVGMELHQIFAAESALGAAVLAAFQTGISVPAQTVTLEDGRQVQISIDRIDDRIDDRMGEATRDGAKTVRHPSARPRDMGILLTLRDTGSALQLEQELEVSRRLAAIGRLTANVGHEVKNPINAMVVHLELLRGKLAGGAFEQTSAQRHVDILADEMHRLDRVVQTLADFSRPMDLDLHEHDLRRVVAQVLDLAGAELKENGIEIISNSPDQPVPVRVDAELLRQALLNLLLNAMQAMPTGGQLRISVGRESRFALVEIADSGIGIPAAILPRIFDLYFTTKPTGSGIGLAMTYRILQLHGGAMDVRSEPDPASPEHGTIFTLSIPVSIAPSNGSRSSSARLASDLLPSDSRVTASTTMDPRETV